MLKPSSSQGSAVRERLVQGLPPRPGPCLWEGALSESLLSEFSVHLTFQKRCQESQVLSSLSLSPGDIGGQMGLFIGASILTILELFDYIYEVRCGIAHGGPPGTLILPQRPEPEHGAGRARPPSIQGRLPLPVCGHCLSPRPRHQGGVGVRDGSRRPIPRAVYTRTQEAGGMSGRA